MILRKRMQCGRFSGSLYITSLSYQSLAIVLPFWLLGYISHSRSPPSWNGMISLGRCCANTTLYVTLECIGTNSSFNINLWTPTNSLKKKCLTPFGARLTLSSMRTSWKMYATPLKVSNTSLLFQTFLISLTSHQLDVSKTFRGHGRSLVLKDRTRVWIKRTTNGEQVQ